jgi:hypothetical protein
MKTGNINQKLRQAYLSDEERTTLTEIRKWKK